MSSLSNLPPIHQKLSGKHRYILPWKTHTEETSRTDLLRRMETLQEIGAGGGRGGGRRGRGGKGRGGGKDDKKEKKDKRRTKRRERRGEEKEMVGCGIRARGRQ